MAARYERQPFGYGGLRTAVSFHHLSQKFQGRFAISLLGDECLKDFSLTIDSPPEVESCTINPYENLDQMPVPLGYGCASMLTASF